MTLLEEARGQTVSHTSPHGFQRQTEDWEVSARGEVFSGEASTGVLIGERRSYWCARRLEWRLSEKVAGGSYGFCEAS